jgi:hypothetical protein
VARLRAGSTARLLPWSGDIFSMIPQAGDPDLVQFPRDPHGRVERMVFIGTHL